jgi:DNA-directed RNA polymerase subunit F
MRSLKKLRREMQGAPEETKVRFEAVAETLTQKIRAYEAELSDLNRKVLSACEAFEKSITEAHGEIKNELGKIHGEHVEDRI